MSQRPEVVVNFNVFSVGSPIGTVSSVVLPDLEPIAVEMRGAGIMGSYNAMVDGHFGSMITTLNFFSAFEGAKRLRVGQYVSALDLRIAEQIHNTITNTKSIRADKVLIGGTVAKTTFGTVAPIEQSSGAIDIETTVLGIWLGGEELLFMDKINYIYRSLGTGLMGDILRAIGM